jgi:glycosyltransferase involved in cell wall biosynthesis
VQEKSGLNEADTLGAVLDGIPSAIPRITGITTIVVDDGSTDRTAAVVARGHRRQARDRQ